MCGIVGFTNKKNLFENEELIIRRMSEKIAHRGETSEGYYKDKVTYLGHRRLSIRDVQGGSQPMSFMDSDNTKYTIIYNGEIYNVDKLKELLNTHNVSLKTNCDTEIVLKLYILFKEKCLNYIKGIFAFCIYNDKDETLFLARDPLGVKPLFYTVIDKDIIFASELKAILCLDEVSKVIDDESISQLIGIGPVTLLGKTIFKGINEVMPGHYILFKDSNVTNVRYHKLKSYTHTDDIEATAKKVKKLLVNSINSQMISDVELGAFLSGGLDSSIITRYSS